MPSTLPELVTEAFAYFRSFPPTAAAAMSLEAHPQGRVRMATLLSEAGAFAGHYTRVEDQQELLHRAEMLYTAWDRYLTQLLPVGWDTRPAEEAKKLEEVVPDVQNLYGYLTNTAQLDIARLPVSLMLLIQKAPEHLRGAVAACALEQLRMTWGSRVNDWIYLNSGDAALSLIPLSTGGTTYLDQVRFGQGGLFGVPVPPKINVINSLEFPDDSALTSGGTAGGEAREFLTLLRDPTTHGYLAAEYPRAVRVLSQAALVELSGGEVECYYQMRPVGDHEDHEHTNCTSLALLTNLQDLPDLLVESYDVSQGDVDRACIRLSVITGGTRETRDEVRSRRVVDPRTKRHRVEDFWVKATYVEPRSTVKSPLIPWEAPDKFSSVELLCMYITRLAGWLPLQQFSEPGLHYARLPRVAWDESVQAGVTPNLVEFDPKYDTSFVRQKLAQAVKPISAQGAEIGSLLGVESQSTDSWKGWAVVGLIQGSGIAADPHMLVAPTNHKHGGKQKKAQQITLARVTLYQSEDDLPFGAHFEQWMVSRPDGSSEGEILWYSLLDPEVVRMELCALLSRVVEQSLRDQGISV